MQYKEVHYCVHRASVPSLISTFTPPPRTPDVRARWIPGLNTEAPFQSGVARSLDSFSLCRQSIGSRGERLGDRRLRLALIEGATTKIIDRNS